MKIVSRRCAMVVKSKDEKEMQSEEGRSEHQWRETTLRMENIFSSRVDNISKRKDH